jgi:hypothetical protein
MIKRKNTISTKKKEPLKDKRYPIEVIVIAMISFIFFPYILAAFVMTFLRSVNSLLIDISFFFSFVIAVVNLICAVISFKHYHHAKRSKITQPLSIVNIVLGSFMCLIGILEVFYCFGILFPYIIVLVDILFVTYVPVAIVVFLCFTTILFFEYSFKTNKSN